MPDNGELESDLDEAGMAFARAIGLLEAHWEICADPFPDACLRRALDRLTAAKGRVAALRAWAHRNDDLLDQHVARESELRSCLAAVLDRCFPQGWPVGADGVWADAVHLAGRSGS